MINILSYEQDKTTIRFKTLSPEVFQRAFLKWRSYADLNFKIISCLGRTFYGRSLGKNFVWLIQVPRLTKKACLIFFVCGKTYNKQFSIYKFFKKSFFLKQKCFFLCVFCETFLRKNINHRFSNKRTQWLRGNNLTDTWFYRKVVWDDSSKFTQLGTSLVLTSFPWKVQPVLHYRQK